MAAESWVRSTAPAVMTLDAAGAARLIEGAADRIAATAACLDPDDDARLMAAAFEGWARASAPLLLALPSIAGKSAARLHAAVTDAEHLTGQYAALARSGVLDETPVGSDLSHRRFLTAALLHLSASVYGMVTQLARIQASEARVAAARALERDLEWTPTPEPAPPAPTPPSPADRADPALWFVGLAVLVLAVLYTLSACTGRAVDTPHSLAQHAISTTWSPS